MSQYFDSDTSDHLYTKVPLKALIKEQHSIRLLRLEPGIWSQRISFTLHERSLDNPPDYTALSYAWISTNTDSPGRNQENPRPTFEEVQCNGATIEIGINLWAALRRLRDTKDANILWVDAVCINQKDHQERNHQVGLMRKIYEKAKSVFIWLGENGEHDDWGEAILPTIFPAYPPSKLSPQSGSSRGNVNLQVQWFGDQRDKPKWAAFVKRQKRRVRRNELDILTHDIFGAFCVLWLLSVGVEASRIYNLRHIAESVTLINGLQAVMEQSWVCMDQPK